MFIFRAVTIFTLCCDAVSGLDTVHCSASGRVNSSSAAHALCGIGIVPYVATRGRPIIGADIKHFTDYRYRPFSK